MSALRACKRNGLMAALTLLLMAGFILGLDTAALRSFLVNRYHTEKVTERTSAYVFGTACLSRTAAIRDPGAPGRYCAKGEEPHPWLADLKWGIMWERCRLSLYPGCLHSLQKPNIQTIPK
ncbi:Uncharacterized protein HZ326_11422 [Fusarium oxysporum f. sp. albedinis]|nr:Uncharacterized protein HZ326_11422 [Fusarium oxysporum f. sp. albedinis]